MATVILVTFCRKIKLIVIASRINRYLDDNAFRNIALGENYFRLMGLS